MPALIDALALLKAQPLDSGSEHSQPSNLEITGIDTGNPAFNVIPATAVARFNIRFNDHHTGDSLKAWIEAQVMSALHGTGVDYTLNYEPVAESFVTSPAGFVEKLSEAVRAETNREPIFSTGGGTSDARFIKDICPVAEIGLLKPPRTRSMNASPWLILKSLPHLWPVFSADFPVSRILQPCSFFFMA